MAKIVLVQTRVTYDGQELNPRLGGAGVPPPPTEPPNDAPPPLDLPPGIFGEAWTVDLGPVEPPPPFVAKVRTAENEIVFERDDTPRTDEEIAALPTVELWIDLSSESDGEEID